MKRKQIVQDLSQLSAEQLVEKIDGYRRELFSLKLNALTAHIKDYSQFKKLRGNIARGLTFLRRKQKSNQDKE